MREKFPSVGREPWVYPYKLTGSPEMKQQATPGRVRWAMPDDMQAIHAVNLMSFRYPWALSATAKIMLDSSLICRVIRGPAFLGTRVAGYVCYVIERDYVAILNMAVRPSYRRSGVGRALLSTVVRAMYALPQCKFVSMKIAERNTPAAVWARSCGLYCGGVVHVGPDDLPPDEPCVVDVDPDGIDTGFYFFSMTREAVPAAMQKGLIL